MNKVEKLQDYLLPFFGWAFLLSFIAMAICAIWVFVLPLKLCATALLASAIGLFVCMR